MSGHYFYGAGERVKLLSIPSLTHSDAIPLNYSVLSFGRIPRAIIRFAFYPDPSEHRSFSLYYVLQIEIISNGHWPSVFPCAEPEEYFIIR